MNLVPAFSALAAIVVLFLFCYWRDRKPINYNKPRIIPYKLIMMFLIVAFLATAAHIVSLITGVQVKPRTKYGM